MTAPAKSKWTWGTGRRKTSVARVRIADGSGVFKVNDREVDDYFTEIKHRLDVIAPLDATKMRGRVDVFVNVSGGGISGQSGAVMLGVARALKKLSSDHTMDQILRDGKFLTRDSRMKERKKYGQKGARKRFQFSKR